MQTYRQHFINLVEDEKLHLFDLQGTALNYVANTARGTNNDLRALANGFHIFMDSCTTDSGKAIDVHELTDGEDVPLNL